MPEDRKNIVIGSGSIAFAGWTPGWTRDAITIGQEDDKIVIDDVQQIIGPVDIRRTRVGFVIKANLYESTLENWQKAFGINAEIEQGSTTRTLKLDVSGDYPEGELIIYGKGPNNVARTIKFYRAKLVDRGEAEQDSRGATVIPVTWQVLVHEDYTEVGVITEEYIPSSVITD